MFFISCVNHVTKHMNSIIPDYDIGMNFVLHILRIHFLPVKQRYPTSAGIANNQKSADQTI